MNVCKKIEWATQVRREVFQSLSGFFWDRPDFFFCFPSAQSVCWIHPRRPLISHGGSRVLVMSIARRREQLAGKHAGHSNSSGPYRPPAAKKRSSGPDPQQQSQQQSKQPTESTAPRVEPNSLISVRKQIRYVKALKEIERKSAFRAPKKERTKESYRKEALSEEERYQQKKLREQEETQLVRDPG